MNVNRQLKTKRKNKNSLITNYIKNLKMRKLQQQVYKCVHFVYNFNTLTVVIKIQLVNVTNNQCNSIYCNIINAIMN